MQHVKNDHPKALIITGPTASGKTQLSEMIASSISCEIINADVGQFYKPLCVGTAKPDLEKINYKHHLFDILDKPQDLSVIKYRELVIELVKDICKRGKIPIIVGGSQFYIKSLFFPPKKLPEISDKISIDLDVLDKQDLWDLLQKIDPERALQLHQNDIYRVKRALQIWQSTGLKPSGLRPEIQAEFESLIIYVQPEYEILRDRIHQRTSLMIEQGGWIQEAESLINTDWESFLKIKGLIGYTEIFDWIRAGRDYSLLPGLIGQIQIQTVQYAKRQKTFWKSFLREILQASLKLNFSIKTLSVGLPDTKILQQVLAAWINISNR